MAERWFDPAGFLLAERVADGSLVGFHWTKVHGAAPTKEHGHEPIGEVYVLGVDPAARGGGLGVALTLAGLRHLQARGLRTAMLYVDESNPGAVALYRKLGFTIWSTDVAYRRRPA
jgi:mycothiol synthase